MHTKGVIGQRMNILDDTNVKPSEITKRKGNNAIYRIGREHEEHERWYVNEKLEDKKSLNNMKKMKSCL